MTRSTAILQLFDRRRKALQAFFRRRIRRRHDVLDLLQETYLRLLRAGDGPIDNPEAYVFTVASNLLKEYSVMQQRQVERETVTDPFGLPVFPIDDHSDEVADLEKQVDILHRVLTELPARYRAVLWMVYEEGLSQSEVAHRLGVSRPMVQKILAKGLGQCRQAMVRQGAI